MIVHCCETKSSNMTVHSFLLIFCLITIFIYLYPNVAYGQLNPTPTQSWTDRENNLRILFSYTPTMPIIDAPTNLKFSVQNLKTGKPMTDLLARVIILSNSSGQERIFRFTNITTHNGVFSIKYLFPDVGLYQVIPRITSPSNASNAVALLASFKVIVPSQPTAFSLSSAGGSSNLWIIFVIIIIAAAIATIFIVKNKKKW
jgi:hypothetical protein